MCRWLSVRCCHRPPVLAAAAPLQVKQGKTPYFLKRTTKEAIAVEERYNELKKGGKLGKFMEKKRQRNASKDQKKMPMRRDY